MDEQKMRELLVIACQRSYAHKIQTGSGGNVSVRVPNAEQMIVKARGSSFADCTVDGFVLTDFDGNVVSGTSQPTKEALLHGLIYRYFPKCGAVVHTHSPYCIAWANTGEKELARVTWHFILKSPNPIPIINVPSAMVRPQDVSIVEPVFKANPDMVGFILKGHGLVAIGADPISAEHTAELMEETAKIAVLEKLLANA